VLPVVDRRANAFARAGDSPLVDEILALGEHNPAMTTAATRTIFRSIWNLSRVTSSIGTERRPQ